MRLSALSFVMIVAACSSGPGLEGSGSATTAARSDHVHDGYLPKGATRSCTAGKVVSAIGEDGSVTCVTPGGPSAGLGTGLKTDAGKTALDTAYTDARYAAVFIDDPSGTSTITRDPTRWIIRTKHDATRADGLTASATRTLDAAKFAAYCGDEDGCNVTLRFKDFADAEDVQRIPASSGPHHVAYNPAVGGVRAADFAKPGSYTEAPGYALDGDGLQSNILRAWNCFLTDAKFTPGTDTFTDAAGSGFELLYYNADTFFKGTCELIIDD